MEPPSDYREAPYPYYLDPDDRIMVLRGREPKKVGPPWLERAGQRGTVLGPNGIDNRNFVRVRWDSGVIADAVPLWAVRRLDLVERLAELA